MKKIIFIALIAVAACNSKQAEPATETHADTVATVANPLDSIVVVNKKDPICTMPTKNHVNDTTTYEGKVFGFCSSECKEEFLKKPKDYLAEAEVQ